MFDTAEIISRQLQAYDSISHTEVREVDLRALADEKNSQTDAITLQAEIPPSSYTRQETEDHLFNILPT